LSDLSVDILPPMPVTIRIPTTLRPMAGGSSTVQVEGATVGEVLGNLDAAHPGFRDRLFDDEGALRRFVNVFVADDDVRFLQGLDTPVPDGETVAIIPAVAGGGTDAFFAG
jgi:molybdopterin converting factor small subunit